MDMLEGESIAAEHFVFQSIVYFVEYQRSSGSVERSVRKKTALEKLGTRIMGLQDVDADAVPPLFSSF